MVKVGIVGIGFMGMMHYLGYRQVRGAKVAAISTRDRKKLAGDWRGIQGNFGPPGERMDLGDVKGYADWQELIADPTIDLVDVCLPPALHEELTIAALAAGKHVLVEKPLALDSAAGKRMSKAAQRAGKLLMVAHVLPFFPEFTFARQCIASGKYGRMLGGHFTRIISEPSWIPDFFNPRTVGGPVIDLHIHDAHFIRLTCGMPESVFSTGRLRDGMVEFFTSQFLYPDNALAVSATSGVLAQQGRSFRHAFEIYLEGATLSFDSCMLDGKAVTSTPLTLLGAKGKVTRPQPKAADAFAAELSEATRAVATGRPSELLGDRLALDALVLCEKQIQSVKSRRVVRVGSEA